MNATSDQAQPSMAALTLHIRVLGDLTITSPPMGRRSNKEPAKARAVAQDHMYVNNRTSQRH